MKTNQFLFFIAIIFLSFACNKPATIAPEEFACDNSPRITKQSFGDLTMKIDYADGKISKVYRADVQGLTENYTYKASNEILIERKFSDGTVGNTFVATLNSDGFIEIYKQISTTAAYTIVNTYNDEGYLETITTKYPNSPSDNSNITNIYAGGNLTQSKTFKNNAVVSTTDYSYYYDKENKADLLRNGNQPGFYGKISKNLMKTMKVTYANKKTKLYEYSFDLNTNGFVKSLTEKYTNEEGKATTQTNKYEYICL